MSQDPSRAQMPGETRIERPDDEDLTAFAEGRLEGAMRQAVLDRLATDEDYYELYAELLRFQDEEADLLDGQPADDSLASSLPSERAGAAGEPVKVLTSLRWWRRPAMAGLAAAALLAVLIAPRLLVRSPTADQLVAGLKPRSEVLKVAPGSTFRDGSPLPQIVDFDENWSFLFGALTVDAELVGTLAEEGIRDAHGDLDRLANRNVWLRLSWDLCEGDTSTCAEEMAEEGVVDGFSMRYGAWCRAVWLALRSEDEAYLSSSAVSSGIRALSRAAPEGDVREEVVDLREKWARRDLDALRQGIETVAKERHAAFKELPSELEGFLGID